MRKCGCKYARGNIRGDGRDTSCGLHYCGMTCSRIHWDNVHKQHLNDYRAAKFNYRIAKDLLAEAVAARRDMPVDMLTRNHMLGIDDVVTTAAAFADQSKIYFLEAKARREQK